MFNKIFIVLTSSFCFFLFSVINSHSDERIYTFNEVVRKESVLYDKVTDTKINGLVRLYSPASGKLFCETSYKDGKENGFKRCFSHAGNLYTETPYNDGVTDGVGKVFYESGKAFAETPYIDGKVNGVLRRYYESGEIFGETPYKNGKIDGVEVNYRKSGSLFQEIKFEDGIAVSGYLYTFWGNKKEMNDSELHEINSEQNEDLDSGNR